MTRILVRYFFNKDFCLKEIKEFAPSFVKNGSKYYVNIYNLKKFKEMPVLILLFTLFTLVCRLKWNAQKETVINYKGKSMINYLFSLRTYNVNMWMFSP